MAAAPPNFATINRELGNMSQSARTITNELAYVPNLLDQVNLQAIIEQSITALEQRLDERFRNIETRIDQTRDEMAAQINQLKDQMTVQINQSKDELVTKMNIIEENSQRRMENKSASYDSLLNLLRHTETGGEIDLVQVGGWPNGVTLETIESATGSHIEDLVYSMGFAFPRPAGDMTVRDKRLFLRKKLGINSTQPVM